MSRDVLILTCEHATNHVPRAYRAAFSGARAALAGHRGFDIGAAALARGLAASLGAPLINGEVSRLLVDLNRSPHHRALFSRYSRSLDGHARERVLERYYHPHRRAVRDAIEPHVRAGRRAIHIAVHSFSPRLAGIVRAADVGLLYDPRRVRERTLCGQWRRALVDARPALHVRRNYPYRGAADGLTTALRRVYSPTRYLGIELEVNQRLLASRAADGLVAWFAATLQQTLR